MKYIMAILLCGLMVLGACSDVEEVGIPLPAKFKVESDEYYVQITNENIDGVAFVYRWINIEGAKYLFTMFESKEVDDETEQKTVQIDDTSILTNNNVRELQVTNRQLTEYVRSLGISLNEEEETVVNLIMEFSAVNAAGEVIKQEETEAAATATIRVVLSRDLNFNGLTD